MPRIRGGRFSASNDGWAFPIGAVAAAGLTAPAWDVQYEADALPADATPAWTRAAVATANQSVASGVLTTSTSGGSAYQYYHRSGVVTAGSITVVESRLQVVSASGADALPIWINIADGSNRVIVAPFTDKLQVQANGNFDYAVDMTTYHVVRLFKYGTTGWALHVDGSLALSGTSFTATATNWISFGHPSEGSAGEVYWDYVYYDLSYLPV